MLVYFGKLEIPLSFSGEFWKWDRKETNVEHEDSVHESSNKSVFKNYILLNLLQKIE